MIEVRRPAEQEIADLAQMDREIFGEHCYSQITMRQFMTWQDRCLMLPSTHLRLWATASCCQPLRIVKVGSWRLV